jgi:hypothetical protein
MKPVSHSKDDKSKDLETIRSLNKSIRLGLKSLYVFVESQCPAQSLRHVCDI